MELSTDIVDNWNLTNKVEDLDENYNLIESLSKKVSNKAKAISNSNTLFEEELESNSFYMSNIFKKIRPRSIDYISKSQNWIGHIIEFSDDGFTAKLLDKNDPTTYEMAEFDIADVSKGDIDLLKLGAIFYWSIGYANQNGQIIKQSLLRFKRSIDFTIDEVDRIADRANELNKAINWD